MLCFINCKKTHEFEVDEGWFYLVMKNNEYFTTHDNFNNRSSNFNEYQLWGALNNKEKKELETLLTDKNYHSSADPASCTIDRCIINIKDNKIDKIYYLGCTGDMIYVYTEGVLLKRIGLNDKGLKLLDSILDY